VVNGDSTLQDKLISMYHDSFISRHSGAIVTVKKMRSLFYCKKQQKPSLILDWVLCEDLSKFNSKEVIFMIVNRLSKYAYFTFIVAKTFMDNV